MNVSPNSIQLTCQVLISNINEMPSGPTHRPWPVILRAVCNLKSLFQPLFIALCLLLQVNISRDLRGFQYLKKLPCAHVVCLPFFCSGTDCSSFRASFALRFDVPLVVQHPFLALLYCSHHWCLGPPKAACYRAGLTMMTQHLTMPFSFFHKKANVNEPGEMAQFKGRIHA